VIHGIIEHLPMVEPMSHVVQERTAAELAPLLQVSTFHPFVAIGKWRLVIHVRR